MRQSIVLGFGLLSAVFMLSACDSSNGGSVVSSLSSSSVVDPSGGSSEPSLSSSSVVDSSGGSSEPSLSSSSVVDSSGGSVVSSLSYSNVVDETAQTITIYSPTCKLVNDVAVFNAQGDTAMDTYSISNDTLTIVDNDTALYLTGNTSGSVYGTWYADFSQLLDEDELDENFPDSLVLTTFTISESGIAIDVDMSQVCYADYIISLLADEYEGVVITKNNCNKVTLASEDGSISMTASFSISYGKSVITVSMNGKSCTETVLNSQVSASNCTADNLNSGAIDEDGMIYSYDNADEFETCEENSFGTEESKVLAKLGSKTSVAAKALAKKIAKERK